MTGDPLTVTDKYVAEWFHNRKTPGLTAAMQVVTGFASPLWVTCVSWLPGLSCGGSDTRYLIGVVAGWTVNPETHFIRAEKTVSIRSSVPLSIQADGDIIGTTPVDVEVLPGVLTVLVSEQPVIIPEEGVHLPTVGLHPIAKD